MSDIERPKTFLVINAGVPYTCVLIADYDAIARRLREAQREHAEWMLMHGMELEAALRKAEEAQREIDDVRTILAGSDIGSLPDHYPVPRMAQNRMDERDKFLGQVETAEAERESLVGYLTRNVFEPNGLTAHSTLAGIGTQIDNMVSGMKAKLSENFTNDGTQKPKPLI